MDTSRESFFYPRALLEEELAFARLHNFYEASPALPGLAAPSRTGLYISISTFHDNAAYTCSYIYIYIYIYTFIAALQCVII